MSNAERLFRQGAGRLNRRLPGSSAGNVRNSSGSRVFARKHQKLRDMADVRQAAGEAAMQGQLSRPVTPAAGFNLSRAERLVNNQNRQYAQDVALNTEVAAQQRAQDEYDWNRQYRDAERQMGLRGMQLGLRGQAINQRGALLNQEIASRQEGRAADAYGFQRLVRPTLFRADMAERRQAYNIRGAQEARAADAYRFEQQWRDAERRQQFRRGNQAIMQGNQALAQGRYGLEQSRLQTEALPGQLERSAAGQRLSNQRLQQQVQGGQTWNTDALAYQAIEAGQVTPQDLYQPKVNEDGEVVVDAAGRPVMQTDNQGNPVLSPRGRRYLSALQERMRTGKAPGLAGLPGDASRYEPTERLAGRSVEDAVQEVMQRENLTREEAIMLMRREGFIR